MKLKFKKLREGAILPFCATTTSVGLDISLPMDMEPNLEDGAGRYVLMGETVVIPLGFAVEIPEGYYGQLTPRSSMYKKGWRIEGIIDADYRGEVGLMIQGPRVPMKLMPGDRVAQMILHRVCPSQPEWVDELSTTERGEGGFGSTDAKPTETQS